MSSRVGLWKEIKNEDEHPLNRGQRSRMGNVESLLGSGQFCLHNGEVTDNFEEEGNLSPALLSCRGTSPNCSY